MSILFLGMMMMMMLVVVVVVVVILNSQFTMFFPGEDETTSDASC